MFCGKDPIGLVAKAGPRRWRGNGGGSSAEWSGVFSSRREALVHVARAAWGLCW